MDAGDCLGEQAQLVELHAEARAAAVQRMSWGLACAAQYAAQKLRRPSRIIRPAPRSQEATELAASAKSQALAAIKVAPKHKPRVIKFTGAVTVPMEAERLPPSADTPRLASGWSAVVYREGPPPVGKPMYQLKTYRSSARRQRQAAGLASAYKRAVQVDQVPGVAEVETDAAVSEADVARMEAWLAHARERMAAREVQQQQASKESCGAQGAEPQQAGSCVKGHPGLALPPASVNDPNLLVARAWALTAPLAVSRKPCLRFAGDLHAPAALPAPAATAGDAASAWSEVSLPAGMAVESAASKLGRLVSVPPDSLKQGRPRSCLAALYQARPIKGGGLAGQGQAEEEGEEDEQGGRDVLMNG